VVINVRNLTALPYRVAQNWIMDTVSQNVPTFEDLMVSLMMTVNI